MARLLFWINTDKFLWSHRLAVARGARDAGYEVHVACTIIGELAGALTQEGFTVHPLRLAAGRAGPLSTLRSFTGFVAILLRVRPDIVHLVTIKPVLFGGIAARLTRVPARVAAISGLGFVFIAQGLAARLRRVLVAGLYRLALGGRGVRVIFQNETDQEAISRLARLAPARGELIPGSGVEVRAFDPAPAPRSARPLVVMAARLLLDKGVREFVEAARLLKARGVAARFVIAGDPHPSNPASVPSALLAAWRDEGPVEFIGHREDVAALYADAEVVALPSYREGMSKSLLEAAAAGRAVVTTDVPGCRDAVIAGETGLLVPPRNAPALAEAIGALLADPERRRAMGAAGRRLAERRFRVEAVVARHLEIYERALSERAGSMPRSR